MGLGRPAIRMGLPRSRECGLGPRAIGLALQHSTAPSLIEAAKDHWWRHHDHDLDFIDQPIEAQHVIVQTNAELALISDFVHRADDLGLNTVGGLPLSYHRSTGDFATWPFEPVGAGDAIDVQQAALAQHHGVPTRLLDWFDDPLIAAHFAADTDDVADRLAVWELPTEESNFVTTSNHNKDWRGQVVELRIVRLNRTRNAHLRAQKGLFMLIQRANVVALDSEGRFPNLQSIASSAARHRHQLARITLPRPLAPELLDELEPHGVSDLHLRPSLDSARGSIERRYLAL